MDLITKIDTGTLTKLEYIKACESLISTYILDSEHMVIISMLSQFNQNWFADYFDQLCLKIYDFDTPDHYKCMGYIVQDSNLWNLIDTNGRKGKSYISKSELRMDIFRKICHAPFLDHQYYYFYISQLIISTKYLTHIASDADYLREVARTHVDKLNEIAIIVLISHKEINLPRSTEGRIFRSIEENPYYMDCYVGPTILKFKFIPILGNWTKLLHSLFVSKSEVEAENCLANASLLFENRLIISSILLYTNLCLKYQIDLMHELLSSKSRLDRSTFKSQSKMELHPIKQGWKIANKLVTQNQLDVNDSLTLFTLIENIFNSEKGFALKLLASTCVSAFTPKFISNISFGVAKSRLLNLSLKICKSNEKHRLGGLRLFYLLQPAEIGHDEVISFVSIFNKAALSGPFQLRWNACLCIEKLYPFVKNSEVVLLDLTYTLISAIKCNNSKVFVSALGALLLFPFQDIIQLSEIKNLAVTHYSHLSEGYQEKLLYMLAQIDQSVK
eukprot:NODE_365_length_8707_cov_1.170423.p2 type:complete len:502 gc:universal NODE_365_length_8707_cov_1.170423:3779-2274(-)